MTPETNTTELPKEITDRLVQLSRLNEIYQWMLEQYPDLKEPAKIATKINRAVAQILDLVIDGGVDVDTDGRRQMIARAASEVGMTLICLASNVEIDLLESICRTFDGYRETTRQMKEVQEQLAQAAEQSIRSTDMPPDSRS